MSVRDQLLDAAVRVYAEVGYRGATTRFVFFGAGATPVFAKRASGAPGLAELGVTG
jgi:hypothetical protein